MEKHSTMLWVGLKASAMRRQKLIPGECPLEDRGGRQMKVARETCWWQKNSLLRGKSVCRSQR